MKIGLSANLINVIDGKPGNNLLEFEMGDIYLGNDPRSFKERSPDEATFLMNAMTMRMAKSFRFYTVGRYGYNNRDDRLFEDIVRGRHGFQILVLALGGAASTFLKFTNCTFVKSLVAPTPHGAIQLVEIKYEGFVNL